MTPQARRERAATKAECLANRIMALRDGRCEAHQHYLCDWCAGQWIESFAAQEAEQAGAQARREERERVRERFVKQCEFYGPGSEMRRYLLGMIEWLATLPAAPPPA